MIFDPVYFLFLAPAMLLAAWAQMRVKSAYAEGSEIRSSSGVTGAQAAAEVMRSEGLNRIDIEPVDGYLSDHYDPRHKVLRLSPGVYSERSLAALGIAAHEAGHALQDAQGYGPLAIRNLLVPVAGFGSNFAWIVMIVGFFMGSMNIIIGGIALFSAVVVFQLVNLPVEFDASRRAREHLMTTGLITAAEEPVVAKVLNAAAWTYVAATLSSILTLLYFLFRSGLLGGRSE
ncbi:zinc metallopeptidase [Tautonia rosea]|uniref:zinc metallopeptidase n=1 Tax=Tautonia rosea TaxID=2728037 RepID=UPI0014738039|nr:zinc metallopeptidase [Tautonia rosea]